MLVGGAWNGSANLFYEFTCNSGWQQTAFNPLHAQNYTWGPGLVSILIESPALNSLINSGQLTAHSVLEDLGNLPVVGEIFDGANVILYIIEGDNVNALYASVAFIPLAGGLIYKNSIGLLKAVTSLRVSPTAV